MATDKIVFIPDGTVTSPHGFFAGAVSAGIKKAKDRLDLGILFSQSPCVATGVFTTVKIKAAAVLLSQARLTKGKARAVVVNSGCANAYTGRAGLADAEAMAALAAQGIGLEAEDVLVSSTGVTGQRLPMEKIRAGISRVVLSQDGGHELARAIMTTDTVPKESAISVNKDNAGYTIGGIAKGAGMIHPNMATMFCFLTTDAAVELDFLKTALKKSADLSFNMISVDGDTSPSDTVLLMANGLAGNDPITIGSRQGKIFQEALNLICVHFAKALARDGEGATRLIEATVSGAASHKEARMAAKQIIGSSLVKTAVHGGDPNWGRIVAALAQSGADVEESKIDLTIGRIAVLKGGKPIDFEKDDNVDRPDGRSNINKRQHDNIIRVFQQEEVPIRVNLNLGTASATAWGCDLSEEYVKINGQYMT